MMKDETSISPQCRPLDTLPLLVINRIMNFCTRPALRNLRLTCKGILHEANRELFATIYLDCTSRSAESFLNLRQQTEIESCIRKVSLKTFEEEKEHCTEVPDELSDETNNAFAGIGSLPKLCGIELIYSTVCSYDNDWGDPPSSWEYRSQILNLLLNAYDSLESKDAMRSLSIYGLQNKNDPVIKDSSQFQKLVAGLKSLELYVVSEQDEAAIEFDGSQPEVVEFLCEMPKTWLTSTHLTSLILYFDRYVGMWPCLDWRETSFPVLQLLALGKHSFSKRWQLDWVSGLGRSLKKLYLDDCIIVYKWDTYNPLIKECHPPRPTAGDQEIDQPEHNPVTFPDRWHHLFDRFAKDLIYLQDFRFGQNFSHSEDQTFSDFLSFDRRYQAESHTAPYASLYESGGMIEFSQEDYGSSDTDFEIPTDCLARDIAAYDRLLAHLGLPASKKI